MPRGTSIEKIYSGLRKKGMDAGKAARISQSQTGLSLQTGKPSKRKPQKLAHGGKVMGPRF